MHEARDIRDSELIDSGNGHQVKWNEYWKEFSQLPVDRMVMALERLNPSENASIIEALHRAKAKSKQRSLEHAHTEIIRLGLSEQEVIEYLEDMIASKGKRKSTSNRISHADGKIVRAIIKECMGKKLSIDDTVGQVTKMGINITKQKVSTYKTAIKKEMAAAA